MKTALIVSIIALIFALACSTYWFFSYINAERKLAKYGESTLFVNENIK